MTKLLFVFALLLFAQSAHAADVCVVLSPDTTTVLYAVRCTDDNNPAPTTIPDTDTRWTTFNAITAAKTTATARQLVYSTSIDQGLTITCAADPSINDTYAIDAVNQLRINTIYYGLKAGDPFPNGSMASFPVTNFSGTADHSFSVAEFESFAHDAVEAYLYGLIQWVKTGTGLPSSTIALPSPPC